MHRWPINRAILGNIFEIVFLPSADMKIVAAFLHPPQTWKLCFHKCFEQYSCQCHITSRRHDVNDCKIQKKANPFRIADTFGHCNCRAGHLCQMRLAFVFLTARENLTIFHFLAEMLPAHVKSQTCNCRMATLLANCWSFPALCCRTFLIKQYSNSRQKATCIGVGKWSRGRPSRNHQKCTEMWFTNRLLHVMFLCLRTKVRFSYYNQSLSTTIAITQ